MILGRILNFAVALAAVAAAAVVCVVAAAFALYAGAKMLLGPAWAAAVVAAAFALIAAVVAGAALRKAPGLGRPKGQDASLIERMVQLAQDRPLVALAAAAAVVVALVRNPAVVSAVVGAFMAGDAAKPKA